MTPTISVESCPHCGGESGFITNIVFKARRLTSWGGMDLDTEGYEVASETDPRCVDCNKPVRSLFRRRATEGESIG